jgi:hypothetical protein
MNNALVNTGIGYPVHGWSQGVCGGGPVPYNPTPWWFWGGIALVILASGTKGKARARKTVRMRRAK